MNIFFFPRKAMVIAIARLAQLPAVLNLKMSIIVHRHQPVMFFRLGNSLAPMESKVCYCTGRRGAKLDLGNAFVTQMFVHK